MFKLTQSSVNYSGRNLLVGASLVMLSLQAHSAPPQLVTPEEMLASNAAPPPFAARAVPDRDAPQIELLNPKLPSSVSSPTPIEVKFQPAASSQVKPETFKVLYGSFQIDITRRILNVAKVTDSGIQVQEASLPKGKHKLLMQIEDNAGRVGSRQVEFEVN